MRNARLAFVLAVAVAPAVARAGSGPDDRQPTDPRSIASATSAVARPVPIEDLYFTRAFAGASWSPDGNEIVLTTNITGRPNLWKVPASGGWPIQLVQSDERQYAPAYSKDGQWIVFEQDTAGNELWDLFAVPAAGGVAVNLTATPDVREESPLWSPDGKTIAFARKPKAGTRYDVALLDWKSHDVHPLTHEEDPTRSWRPFAWSRDGKTLYAGRAESGHTDSDVYAIDVASGRATNLTPHEGKVLYDGSSLSPDGKTLLVASNAKGGFNNVALLDVASKKLTWVTDTRWDAVAGDFAPDGKSFTYLLNADGEVDVYRVAIRGLKATRLETPPGVNALPGAPTSFSPRGDLLVAHQSSSEPRDFWVYAANGKGKRRLTAAALASLAATPLPESHVVHYQSFDGKMISAFVWVPFNLARDGTHPALVLPHGGPTGQYNDVFNPAVAAYVSRGYICIAPNPRGSTGYGMAFQKANEHDLGGGDLQDEVYAAKLLVATGYVDAKKIGITGGSYGGFMTMMALAKTPEVWAAGVELFGIIDWRTMLQHSDPSLQEYVKMLLGDPVKDAAVYERASPITYLKKLRAPLLVLQGDNDPRVPKEEAEQVVAALKRSGRVVDAHYYANEGHGFVKRENQIDSLRRSIEWLDRYVKGNAPQAAAK